MITVQDLSKEELASQAVVLASQVDRAWLEYIRASEVVEKLSRKPNVNEQTWKRAMNKEKRLFAEWQRLREQRAAVLDARDAAFDRMM